MRFDGAFISRFKAHLAISLCKLLPQRMLQPLFLNRKKPPKTDGPFSKRFRISLFASLTKN